jgi:hypothetical protein
LNIRQRVRSLEERHGHAGIGRLLDALAAADAGEPVDWKALAPAPALVAALAALNDGRKTR